MSMVGAHLSNFNQLKRSLWERKLSFPRFNLKVLLSIGEFVLFTVVCLSSLEIFNKFGIIGEVGLKLT